MWSIHPCVIIINKITNIPKFILKTADRAAAIPGEVKAKIKGNITLYIRANDIEVLYNNLLNLLIYLYLNHSKIALLFFLKL